MSVKVTMDIRLEKFIQILNTTIDETRHYIKFIDMPVFFEFETTHALQDLLEVQARERFYNKELRKGYFDYVDENGNEIRYFIESVSDEGEITLKE